MAEDSEMASSTSQLQSSSQISHEGAAKRSQIPAFSGFPDFPNGDYLMIPIMYPAIIPGLASLQNQEQITHGAGIYAVPVLPFVGHVSGLPSNTLIPLTYNMPTTRPADETGSGGEEHGQAAQPQQRQQQQAAAQGQVVVRRFQIAFQLDLLLMLKLAAIIYLFNQDVSRQRLVVVVFFALLFYLYQTGALTPLVQWLSQSMQRAAAPPHPPMPAVRPENVPADAGNGNEHAALAEGEAGAENGNRPAEGNRAAVENENVVEGGIENGGNHWWGIVIEIQMIIFGFITSLLPGFHNID